MKKESDILMEFCSPPVRVRPPWPLRLKTDWKHDFPFQKTMLILMLSTFAFEVFTSACCERLKIPDSLWRPAWPLTGCIRQDTGNRALTTCTLWLDCCVSATTAWVRHEACDGNLLLENLVFWQFKPNWNKSDLITSKMSFWLPGRGSNVTFKYPSYA